MKNKISKWALLGKRSFSKYFIRSGTHIIIPTEEGDQEYDFFESIIYNTKYKRVDEDELIICWRSTTLVYIKNTKDIIYHSEDFDELSMCVIWTDKYLMENLKLEIDSPFLLPIVNCF